MKAVVGDALIDNLIGMCAHQGGVPCNQTTRTRAEYCTPCEAAARLSVSGERHGIDCPKVEHRGAGYLHGADDDRPYDVDGTWYCGRCHQCVPRK